MSVLNGGNNDRNLSSNVVAEVMKNDSRHAKQHEIAATQVDYEWKLSVWWRIYSSKEAYESFC